MQARGAAVSIARAACRAPPSAAVSNDIARTAYESSSTSPPAIMEGM